MHVGVFPWPPCLPPGNFFNLLSFCRHFCATAKVWPAAHTSKATRPAGAVRCRCCSVPKQSGHLILPASKRQNSNRRLTSTNYEKQNTPAPTSAFTQQPLRYDESKPHAYECRPSPGNYRHIWRHNIIFSPSRIGQCHGNSCCFAFGGVGFGWITISLFCSQALFSTAPPQVDGAPGP